MNGVLAWTQSTGMPMRPAMSTMMTTDIAPADAADAGVDVRLDVPAAARAGEPVRALVQLTDAGTGEPVDDLGLSHEVWMHLIVTREDLGTFAHLHPEPTGEPGQLAVDLDFPTAGSYRVDTEFRRRGGMNDIHASERIVIGGTAPAAAALAEDTRPQVAGGVRVELGGTARAGGTSELSFSFTDAATGAPVDDLQPYLAAAGHVVIMGADGSFAHEHAEVEDGDGNPVFALPGQQFGPDLAVHAHFDDPGLYRLWGQFRLGDGRVVTVPFTVRAS
jgi:Cu+-exporting ATPase